jgi:hypothetical protein
MTDTEHNPDSPKMEMPELLTEFYKLDLAIERTKDEGELERLTSQQSDVMADLAQCPVTSPSQAIALINCLFAEQRDFMHPTVKDTLDGLKDYLEASKGDRGREAWQAFQDINDVTRALEARSRLLLRLAEMETNGLESILSVTGEDIEHDLKALEEAHKTLRSICDGKIKAEAARCRAELFDQPEVETEAA